MFNNLDEVLRFIKQNNQDPTLALHHLEHCPITINEYIELTKSRKDAEQYVNNIINYAHIRHPFAYDNIITFLTLATTSFTNFLVNLIYFP